MIYIEVIIGTVVAVGTAAAVEAAINSNKEETRSILCSLLSYA